MDTFGSYLKAERENRGIRLEEIASITKIHLSSLERLERSQWEKLPPEPFIRGFLSAYAKYIGLDLNEVLDRYHQEVDPKGSEAMSTAVPISDSTSQDYTAPKQDAIDSTADPKSPSEVMERHNHHLLRKAAMFSGVLAFVGLVVGITYVGKKAVSPHVTLPSPATPIVEAPVQIESTKQVDEVQTSALSPALAQDENRFPSNASAQNLTSVPPSQPEKPSTALPHAESKTEPLVEPQKVSVAPEPSTATAVPAASHEIVVEGKVRTWMKVVIDDAPPNESFLPAGEKASFKANEKIKIVLGDSTGAKIIHNGEASDGKKFSGTIRIYSFPANARFPQDPPKRFTASPASTEELQPVAPTGSGAELSPPGAESPR